jgi:ornithine cyclodeaminase/alanine dehydrogenase
VRAYSRRLSTARSFAEEASAEGLAAKAVAEPRQALEGADIVITTTPAMPRTAPFLDAAWLGPGSFAAMVDLGPSWITETLRGLARVVTDDIDQAGTERLNYPKPYDGEVAQLVSGSLEGRQSPEERTAIVFAGVGLADVAVAAAVYERASERRLGTVLPL